MGAFPRFNPRAEQQRMLTSNEILGLQSVVSVPSTIAIDYAFAPLLLPRDDEEILRTVLPSLLHLELNFRTALEQDGQSIPIVKEIGQPLPKELKKKIKKMKMGNTRKECSICMNPFAEGEVIRLLPCKHIFHNDCLRPWLCSHSSCPNCRLDLISYFKKQGKSSSSPSE
eukprot:TRINITY_DN2016_c0_g1_i2.p1 TRINITY_DN2016_c0_g1~~TRINITY_DN2016_c0_g1_i2.p1  ORF type:complete len:170 (-),score=22.49 TRINITY_DN2016_c0_g1_i2:118-627(-)